MNYGYARVSTREQNLDRQIAALMEAGVAKNKIFSDKQSGKDFARPQYQKMTYKMKPGDVMFVKELDRLGRNYDEIIAEWRELTKVKGVDIVVLDMPLLDTRQGEGGLTGQFISDMALTILSYVADIERQKNRRRQAEGIAIAREKGIKFGRPVKSDPEMFKEIAIQYLNKELSSRQAAEMCGLCQSTFLRKVKKLKMNLKLDFFTQASLKQQILKFQ